jgi:hypothetical protein
VRIEIDDSNCQRHTISTLDMTTAGRWAAEHFTRLMSADARFGDCRLRIWPDTYEEMDLIGSQEVRLDVEGLDELCRVFWNAAERLADKMAAA